MVRDPGIQSGRNTALCAKGSFRKDGLSNFSAAECWLRADRVREHDHDSLLCTDGFLNIEVVCCCLVEGLAFGATNAEPLNRPPCDNRHPLPQADRHREPLPRSSSARSKTEAAHDFLCSINPGQFLAKGTVAPDCDQAQTGRRAFRGV